MTALPNAIKQLMWASGDRLLASTRWETGDPLEVQVAELDASLNVVRTRSRADHAWAECVGMATLSDGRVLLAWRDHSPLRLTLTEDDDRVVCEREFEPHPLAVHLAVATDDRVALADKSHLTVHRAGPPGSRIGGAPARRRVVRRKAKPSDSGGGWTELARIGLGQGGVTVLSIAPDGGTVLSASVFVDGLRAFDAETGRQRWKSNVWGHVIGLTWSPDGQIVGALTRTPSPDPATTRKGWGAQFFRAENGRPRVPDERIDDVTALAWHPDGRSILGRPDGSVRIGDRSIDVWPGVAITALAMHPDGARLAVGGAGGQLALVDA